MAEHRGFLTTTELVERWPADRKTILNAIKAGEVPCTRLGRKWLIPLAWVEAQEGATPPVDLAETAS